MPHFGLIDATKLTEADAMLLRVRLHIRGGTRRFERGMLAAGIASLYDALCWALRWDILLPEHRIRLGIIGNEEFRDERDIYAVLVRSGVIADTFDFNAFEHLVDQSLNNGAFQFDAPCVLVQIEEVMTELEVMPFDEAALPSGDPAAR